MALKRRQFVKALGVAAGLVAGAGTASAADVTVNLGYAGAEDSTYGVLAGKFEELAEKYTDGSVDIKIRCCTQLATEDEAYKAMQLGTIDMYIITHNNVAPHFPLMNAFVLPYIFHSREHAYEVLDGPVGDDIKRQIREDTKVHLLTYGFVGQRDFYNSVRPIDEMSDVEGIKIRVPKNQVMVDTWGAFGAAPIPLPWSETAAALQTGTVQGGDNGTSFIKSQKFYELMDHLAIMEHFSYFSPLFASPRVMNKFSDSQREAILRAADEAGEHHRKEMGARIADIRDWLGDEGGMKVTYPDKEDFIAAATKLQNDWLADKPQKFEDLVEKIRAAAE
jgi:tripartite ATP-independent transporter DctP family solute receptor